MKYIMTLEELQARLAIDLGPKYKGPKRKVNVTFENLQKAIANDLREIEEEEKNNQEDMPEFDFDLDDIDNIDASKKYSNDNDYERKAPKKRRKQNKTTAGI